MKTLLTLFLTLVVAAIAGGWYWMKSREEAPQFRELPVERGDLLLAVRASGTVEPVEVVDVGAQIKGRIKCFGPDLNGSNETVDYCSTVKEGAVLAQLDDQPYLVEAERVQADLDLAEAELERYEAKLDQAQQDFERAERLRETNAESEYDKADALHKMAQADVKVGQARVEQAKLAVKEAQINLDYTVIKSPIDGVVIDRRVNVGQTVIVGLNAPSLFLLARNLNRMRVWAAVNEADIGDIHIGQCVTFRVDAYRDAKFEGLVSQIRLNASMSHNVVIYGVMIDVDNADGKLMPYMTASIQFEVARRDDILLVPNQALRWRPTPEQITPRFRDRFSPSNAAETDERLDAEGKVLVDSPTVWVISDDGLVRPAKVVVGLSDGMGTELLEGDLKQGDQLVSASIRKAEKDFVSSFISKVTKTRK